MDMKKNKEIERILPGEAVTPGLKADSKIKRLTLDIPAALHRAIKLNAVEEGVTMVEKLRTLLLEHYGLKGTLDQEPDG